MWNGSSWSALPINPLGTVAETFWWSADVAYEQLSGDALLVWADGTNLKWSKWNGASWSTPATPTAGNTYKTVKLASKPGSNEIMLVVSADNRDFAMVWTGSTWLEHTLYTAAQTDFTDVNVAYEQASGHAMVTYGKNSDAKVYYQIWDGTAWSAEASVDPPAPS